MRKLRTIIGRTLVFKTRGLPKCVGVPVRRLGRKILFNHLKKPASPLIGL